MNTLPRGIRLNNPGNVDRTNIPWQGMANPQTDPRFITFIAPSWGFRCMARIIRTYTKEGAATVQDIVNKWAPPVENNTSSYVTDVCQRMSVQPTDSFDFNSQIKPLLKAITWHEQGMFPYDDAPIDLGITLEAAS